MEKLSEHVESNCCAQMLDRDATVARIQELEAEVAILNKIRELLIPTPEVPEVVEVQPEPVGVEKWLKEPETTPEPVKPKQLPNPNLEPTEWVKQQIDKSHAIGDEFSKDNYDKLLTNWQHTEKKPVVVHEPRPYVPLNPDEVWSGSGQKPRSFKQAIAHERGQAMPEDSGMYDVQQGEADCDGCTI